MGSLHPKLRESSTDSWRPFILAVSNRALDKDGNVLLDRRDDGVAGRPEVRRGDLRRILLESLPADTVRWGHKLRAAPPLGGGRHELRFDDGSTATSELLVGADSARSKVRPPLSEAKPAYTSVTRVETYLYDGDTRHKASAEAVGGGLCMRWRQERVSSRTASPIACCIRTLR